MPRLPDASSLGARPTPRVQRSVATVRNRGGVAEAAAAFGAGVSDIAGKALERQDKLNYAAAKASLLKADIAARIELQDDPDYGTMEQRYTDRMAKAREAASKLVQHKGDRGLFDQDIGVDIERGLGEVKKLVRDKRVSFETATLDQTLSDSLDIGQTALDEETREANLANVNSLIDGAVQRGVLDPVEAGKRKRGFAQDYVVQRLETLRNAEDIEGAWKFFESNRGRLDQATESRVENLLTDAKNNRQALTVADEIVDGLPVSSTTPGVQGGTITYASPVRGTVTSQFGAKRGNGAHSGMDIAAPLGTPIVPVAPGKVIKVASNAGPSGNFVMVRHADGRVSSYAHMGKITVQQGDQVGAGTQLGTVGMTGRTSGPHVHLVVRGADGKRVDPAKVIGSASTANGKASDGPERHNLRQLYENVDARAKAEGWSPEQTERVKAQVARRVSREDELINREEGDAYEASLAKAETLGEDFTDPSQLGDAYYRASEIQQRTLRNMAEANAKAKAAVKSAAANGEVVRALHRMAVTAPGDFAKADLRPYKPFMTPGEYDEVSTSQARAQEEDGKWTPRTGVQTAITWGEKFGGVEIKDDSDRFRVYRYIEGRARQFRDESKGKAPAEDDYLRWFREAAQTYNERRAFEVLDAAGGITGPYRKQIIRNFRAVNGRDPNEAEIQQWFDRMGEAIK